MLIKEMIYWITAREQMRLHKESGAAFPHHPDPVMANNRYTNVRREDDKVTKWLAEHWRKPGKDLTKIMALARMVNYIPSLEEIGRDFTEWDPEVVKEVLWHRIDREEKTWSSAYMITTCGKKMDKVGYVVDHVCSNVKEVDHCGTLYEANKLIRQCDGMGSFLAAQVIADLKNTNGTKLREAPDWMTWSAPGPGSLKGLSEFFEYTVTDGSYEKNITKAWAAIRPGLPPHLQDLHMQDVQNVFCEFSKYCRGYGRNKYRG